MKPLPLSLRLLQDPPELLQRMLKTPLKRKREVEFLPDSDKSSKSTRKESLPDIKRCRTSLKNWTSGSESVTKKGKEHLLHTKPRSWPSSQHPRKDSQPHSPPRSLLERISPNLHLQEEPEVRLKTSSVELQKGELRMTKKSPGWRSDASERRTCLGTTLDPCLHDVQAALKPVDPSERSVRICPELDLSCEWHTNSPKEFRLPSGTESSRENPSTLIKYCRPCTLSNLMKREKDAWEALKLFLPFPSLSAMSEQVRSGPQHSGEWPTESSSSSLTDEMNSLSMQTISRGFLQQNIPAPTPKLSYSISQYGTKWVADKIRSSPTTSDSMVLAKPYSMPTELSMEGVGQMAEVDEEEPDREEDKGSPEVERKRLVKGSMARTDASSMRMTASTNISVKTAERAGMGSRHVVPKGVWEPGYGLAPKYLRYNIWDPQSEFTRNTADWTETAHPLARPPQSEIDDSSATETIRTHSHLFKIVTPIRVDVFESYLQLHPNQPFVESVCAGLREGFWPWASVSKPGYPEINDESQLNPSDKEKLDILRSQRDIELEKGRFSESFGQELLPGMYSMPIYAVPKPHSTDLRLVTDHSCGRFSLNSMIQHERVTGFPLDNMIHFGEMIMDLEIREPGKKKLAWKSDISEAYRILPMHPLWQVKQVNTLDGERHVDRCNAFGGCASGGIFISFNSLVAWIARNVKKIRYLTNYVDDSSGCGLADDMEWYEPYKRSYPKDQVTLMCLWDDLGIPHREKKQVFGSPLTIIGISVDVNDLSLTLPEEAKLKLIEELKWWVRPGGKEKLRRWYQMGGWFNWALNVFPLLRPALNNFYPKIKGRRDSTSLIWINNKIRDDFTWALNILAFSPGIRQLKSVSWGLNDASSISFCDACPEGMGFWYPSLGIGFYSPTPSHDNPDLIFYFEALCVLSALFDAHLRSPNGSRFIIYTDNSNTVDIFNTLRALPSYNHLLRAAVDILLDGKHDVRVLHIQGCDNVVADALSRARFQQALHLIPTLKISPFDPWSWAPHADGTITFQPPRHALGVVRS
jgi:hypothetical protein